MNEIRRWDFDASLEYSQRTGDVIGAVADAVEMQKGSYVLHSEHQAEIDRLRAENEALAKDAARYRWLRNPASSVSDGGKGLIIEHGGKWYVLSEADEAIDAAMEAK